MHTLVCSYALSPLWFPHSVHTSVPSRPKLSSRKTVPHETLVCISTLSTYLPLTHQQVQRTEIPHGHAHAAAGGAAAGAQSHTTAQQTQARKLSTATANAAASGVHKPRGPAVANVGDVHGPRDMARILVVCSVGYQNVRARCIITLRRKGSLSRWLAADLQRPTTQPALTLMFALALHYRSGREGCGRCSTGTTRPC